MKQFILGFNDVNDLLNDVSGENLIEFQSTTEADFNCEEWCTVNATSIEEAREEYENSFFQHKANNRIMGPFNT